MDVRKFPVCTPRNVVSPQKTGRAFLSSIGRWGKGIHGAK